MIAVGKGIVNRRGFQCGWERRTRSGKVRVYLLLRKNPYLISGLGLEHCGRLEAGEHLCELRGRCTIFWLEWLWPA